MKDKLGNKLTIKEYFHKWKIGIDNLTPMQKLSNDINGTFVTLVGFIAALIAVILEHKLMGWLTYGLILIFIGSIWTTAVKWISLRIQYKFMKGLDLESEEKPSCTIIPKIDDKEVVKIVSEIKDKIIDLDKDNTIEEVVERREDGKTTNKSN